jgi:hypothetical protein
MREEMPEVVWFAGVVNTRQETVPAGARVSDRTQAWPLLVSTRVRKGGSRAR